MAGRLAVMGILVGNRGDKSPAVQQVLSDFGDQILMRAGVPSPDRERGLITLALEADSGAREDLSRRLQAIEGVTVRTIDF